MLRKGGVHQMIKAHYAKALMNEKFRLDFQRKMKINWYHTFQRKIFKNSNWYIFAPMCMLSFLWQSSVQFRANGTKRSRKPIIMRSTPYVSFCLWNSSSFCSTYGPSFVLSAFFPPRSLTAAISSSVSFWHPTDGCPCSIVTRKILYRLTSSSNLMGEKLRKLRRPTLN